MTQEPCADPFTALTSLLRLSFFASLAPRAPAGNLETEGCKEKASTPIHEPFNHGAGLSLADAETSSCIFN